MGLSNKKKHLDASTSRETSKVTPVIETLSDTEDENMDDNDSFGAPDENEIEQANQMEHEMLQQFQQGEQNEQILPAEHVEVIFEEAESLPDLEQEDEPELVLFEPHSPPNSPPDVQDEGFQDEPADDEPQQEHQQDYDFDLDEEESLIFRETSWNNIIQNRNNYHGKPYESTFTYNSLLDFDAIKKIIITTSTLAGINQTVEGEQRIHSIECRGATIQQVTEAVKVELGSLQVHPTMKFAVICGLNDLCKANFNLQHTINRYHELKNYLKSLNPGNTVEFIALPIPPKLSALVHDDHQVLIDRTFEILQLNSVLKNQLSDSNSNLSLENKGIVSTLTGNVDTFVGYGEIFTIGSRHILNHWRESNPIHAMHLKDNIRKAFFREKLIPFFNH